jgi:hypothetical protein
VGDWFGWLAVTVAILFVIRVYLFTKCSPT